MRTAEEYWTIFTSEGGDYAKTQYPLFERILCLVRNEALDQAAQVCEGTDKAINTFHLAKKIRALKK